jgi:hypothetical protein
MSLFEVNPADCIRFDLFGQSKSETLKIKNTSQFQIAYKIRTTASKSYIVKPNQGYLNSGESIVVTISVQTNELQQDIKHKFLVLGTNAANVPDFNLFNTLPKEKIFEVKLDVMSGNRPSLSENIRKSGVFADSRSTFDALNADDLAANIKKLESEKNSLEGRLNHINSELMMKQNWKKADDSVKFKRNALILYAVGGFFLGYFYGSLPV